MENNNNLIISKNSKDLNVEDFIKIFPPLLNPTSTFSSNKFSYLFCYKKPIKKDNFIYEKKKRTKSNKNIQLFNDNFYNAKFNKHQSVKKLNIYSTTNNNNNKIKDNILENDEYYLIKMAYNCKILIKEEL